MASDINTKSTKNKKRSVRHRKSGSLTLRILTVNVLPLILLVTGLLYLGQYRNELIRAELETLKAQSQLFTAALTESAVKPVERDQVYGVYSVPVYVNTLMPDLSRRLIRRFGETSEARMQLFTSSGELLADTHQKITDDGVIQIIDLSPPENEKEWKNGLRLIMHNVIDLLPTQTTLPPYPETNSTKVNDYPEAMAALNDKVAANAYERENAEGRTDVVMVAAAPIRTDNQTLGVLMLTREGKDIETVMTKQRFDVITIFLGALSLTIFISLYLAHLIGRPLKRLAKAAESIRQERGRKTEIPDFSRRNDEIGELSHALQDMTQALWDRMDTIEKFAADVSHELKNPLTSLRSAVETAEKIKDEKQIKKLMSIIQHDVQRLDRLITDISSASRLDAELSRSTLQELDVGTLLHKMVNSHRTALENAADTKKIDLFVPKNQNLFVLAIESRLAQVFDNLITNALSFSPEDGSVSIKVADSKSSFIVTVEDQGPGIPQKNLDTIFERFYTERPKHEDYGSHSGLGLSISKQIIKAHGGSIHAENIVDAENKRVGARFVVELNKAG